MKIEIIENTYKKVTADDGKVLSQLNQEFAEYPKEVMTALDDDSWYEIDAPIIETEAEVIN